jgi:CRISPR-associated endonuclease/helicase Cas3
MIFGENISFDLAGKWGDDGKRHPLIFHLADTAAVSLALWEFSLGRHARRDFAAALGLCENETKRLLAFWVGLHDIGKASPAFQIKNPTAERELTAAGFAFPRHLSTSNDTYHNLVTAKVLPDVLRPVHVGANEALLRDVAAAVGGHHGSFASELAIAWLNDEEVGAGKWTGARRQLAEELARLTGTDNETAMPPDELAGNHPFFVTLAGLTSVCDWLASAEGHFFPHDEAPTSADAYWGWARNRAEEFVIRDLRWRRWNDAPEPRTFRAVFPHLPIEQPFPLQREMRARADDIDGAALVIIEAPMGEGKTEAALYLADKWLREPGAEGFYFALPTMATSNQMFGRVHKYLSNRFPEEILNLHLLHSGARLVRDDLIAESLKLDTYDDQHADGAVVAEEWFTAKKRGLISPFGVGTVDQALMAVLQVRHVAVRLYGLAHKIIIVDEVHAYDAYMSVLLERLLEWLAELGAPVILLSATLPSGKRRELVRAYTGGAGDGVAEDVAYPRITIAGPDRKTEVVPVEAAAERRMTVRLAAAPLAPAGVASAVAEALAGGGCAAVICNTVGRAQEVYRALKDDFAPGRELGLLHARFPFAAREEREHRYLGMLGKDATNRPAKFVLVGTQVLEQSLDVDFDVMFTDLAPADLVLQRMGRLHRHQRDERPPGLATPTLHIMHPGEDEEGVPDFGTSAYVYEPYVLLRSWLALKGRDEVRVPADLEAIVEEVYGEDEPPVSNEAVASALAESREDYDEKIKEKRKEAARRALPSARDDNFELSALRGLLEEEEDPKVAPILQGLTRDGKPTLTLICVNQENEGYSIWGTGGKDSLDLYSSDKPSVETRAALLLSSVKVSDARVFDWFIKNDETPPGWRRDPYLRFSYPLILRNGIAQMGEIDLILDEDTGLIISTRS